MANLCEGTLFGMGNPLLDITATVDEAFLEKYKLKANAAILAEDIHLPLYEDLKKSYKVEYCAGGATQNVLRTAQWVLGKPNITTFMGGVGDDENERILAKSATADGVNVQYQVMSEYATGTCAVLITGVHRSLCAYLGAADHFSVDYLTKPENFAYVERAKFYYISGFFITASPESFLKVAEYACSQKRVFMMNLSAAFISQFFIDRVNKALPNVDILFGNEVEAEAFSEAQNFGTKDVTEIAVKAAALPKNNDRPRMVVFTQGVEPVIVVQGTVVKKFPITKLAPEAIKDTNGAGDAFCGGFVSQYIQGKPLETCVQCGIWCATEVIQQLGCNFPKNKTFQACLE